MKELTATKILDLSKRTGIHVYDIAQAVLRYPEIAEIVVEMEQNNKDCR